MPPRVTVSKEQVLQGALDLVRREGLDSLSARRVAQELGCSTQPVYRAYGAMEDLRQELMQRAGELAMSYLRAGDDPERAFLQVGLGTLQFAQEEPNLYRAVILDGPVMRDMQQGKAPPDFVLERMRAAPELSGLDDEQLTRINALMWFFSQGLANLFFSQREDDPMHIAREYLMQAGRAVIEHEQSRRRS